MKGTNSLSDYLRKFKTIFNELAITGKPIYEQKKSWWLLNSLGKEFTVFTATML